MNKILTIIFSLNIFCQLHAGQFILDNPKDCIVVYGKNASKATKDICRDFALNISENPQFWSEDNYKSDEYVLRFPHYYNQKNLLVIGTPTDNRLIKKNAPAFLTSNEQFFFSDTYGVCPKNASAIIHTAINPFVQKDDYLDNSKNKQSDARVALYIVCSKAPLIKKALSNIRKNKTAEALMSSQKLVGKNGFIQAGASYNQHDLAVEINRSALILKNGTETLRETCIMQEPLLNTNHIERLTGIDTKAVFRIKLSSPDDNRIPLIKENYQDLILIEYQKEKDALESFKNLNKATTATTTKNPTKLIVASQGKNGHKIYLWQRFILLENLEPQWQGKLEKQLDSLFRIK